MGMRDQLIAIRQEIPSPESELIGDILSDAQMLDPWTPSTKIYDIAVCVGPVTSCPPAKKRVLFVLGQTRSHQDLDWDYVVVTSEKARKLATKKFGHGTRVMKLIPPVLALEKARRRLVTEKRGFMHASEVATYPTHAIKMLNLWGLHSPPERHNGTTAWMHGPCDYWFMWDMKKPENVLNAKSISLFTAFEFNSLVRGGAIGFYPRWMEDGYDIQVRRHLALGGRVKCPKDPEVLGEHVDLVDDLSGVSLCDLDPRKPVVWEGKIQDYANGIKEMIGRL